MKIPELLSKLKVRLVLLYSLLDAFDFLKFSYLLKMFIQVQRYFKCYSQVHRIKERDLNSFIARSIYQLTKISLAFYTFMQFKSFIRHIVFGSHHISKSSVSHINTVSAANYICDINNNFNECS